jgi:putative methyltransferase (TIGR04325 family)
VEGYDEASLARLIMEADKALIDSHGGPECEHLEYIFDSAASKSLRVLDFGGGGGRHGFRYLTRAKSWAVVETPAMASAANEILSIDSLSFHSGIQEAVDYSGGGIDVLHVSSSLQYTPDPMGVLTKLLNLDSEILVFEKLVTTKSAKPFRFLQYSFLGDNVAGHSKGFLNRWGATRYLLTAMSKSAALEAIEQKYEVVRAWSDPSQSHLPIGKDLEQWGFIASRKI